VALDADTVAKRRARNPKQRPHSGVRAEDRARHRQGWSRPLIRSSLPPAPAAPRQEAFVRQRLVQFAARISF